MGFGWRVYDLFKGLDFKGMSCACFCYFPLVSLLLRFAYQGPMPVSAFALMAAVVVVPLMDGPLRKTHL